MAKGKLFALIVVVGALGVVAATGAFTTVTAERTATINVSGDDAALLQMDPSNETDLVSMNENTGTIQIDVSGENGAGLNPVATTTFDPALNVTNQGSQDIGLSVDVSVDSSQLDDEDFESSNYTNPENMADALANSTVIEIYNVQSGIVGEDGNIAQLAGGGSSVVIDDDAPTDATAILGTGESATIAVAFDLTDNNGGVIEELDSEDIEIAIEFTADADALNDN